MNDDKITKRTVNEILNDTWVLYNSAYDLTRSEGLLITDFMDVFKRKIREQKEE